MSTFNFKVGDKVIIEEWPADKFLTITAVGETNFLAKDSNEYEGCWSKKYFERVWLPYTPPKKTVRMAPALIALNKIRGGIMYKVTNEIYPSLEKAKDGERHFVFLKWPASENLWVDVPVEE